MAEISGVARIYNQSFFQNLYNRTGRWAWPGGADTPCPLLVQLKALLWDVPCVMGCMPLHGICAGLKHQ